MAWLLLIVTGVLTLLVLALAVLTVRLRGRIDGLEHRLAGQSTFASLDEPGPAAPETEYVITRVGEPEVDVVADPAPIVAAPVFADIVLRETVVQTASLFHGLRRALAPETRNRIRFHMRQEVKRSRKQRRMELREVRREWAARQRAGMAAEDQAA